MCSKMIPLLKLKRFFSERFSYKRSLVGLLAAWYILSNFLLVILASSYLYLSLQKALSRNTNSALLDRLQTLTTFLTQSSDPISDIRGRVTEWTTWKYAKYFVKIVDLNHNLIFQLPGLPPEIDQQVFPFEHTSDIKGKESIILGKQVRTHHHLYATLSQFIRIKTKFHKDLWVSVALELTDEDELLDHYKAQLIEVLGIVFFISLALGHSLVKAGFRPLEEMVQTTDKIRSSTLHERFPVDKLPIELQKLAMTINEMLDRLEDSFGRLSSYSSDLAHELRTPLNNLKGEIEVILVRARSTESYQEVLYSALEEVNRLSKIIESLLFISQAENPQTQVQKEEINPVTEIENIVDFYGPTASDEEVEIKIDIQTSVPLFVEKTLFQRAISNVISNAINYSSRGSLICIELSLHEGNMLIKVIDRGPGIPQEHLTKIFDRFYRADSSRSSKKLGGVGLGLAITKSILQLHGGTIKVQSLLGQGTEVVMFFPTGSI